MLVEGGKIPNTTHPEVPIGPEDKFALLKLVGSKPKFDFTPKDHLELGIIIGPMICANINDLQEQV